MLSYADLARAYEFGMKLPPAFGDTNTDKSDLSRSEARRQDYPLPWVVPDQLIPSSGSERYHHTKSQSALVATRSYSAIIATIRYQRWATAVALAP